MWTQRLYRRLSLTFGHIAHYNSHGFWGEFFDNLQGKVAFLEQTLTYPCYCQPDHTYCDVERAVQSRLHAAKTLATYRALRAAEIEGAERALLTACARNTRACRHRARLTCQPSGRPRPVHPDERPPRSSQACCERRRHQEVPHHRPPPQGSRAEHAPGFAGCALAPPDRDAARGMGLPEKRGGGKPFNRSTPWPNFAASIRAA